MGLVSIADVASTGGPGSLSTLLPPFVLSTLGCNVVKLGVPGRSAGAIDSLATLPGRKGIHPGAPRTPAETAGARSAASERPVDFAAGISIRSSDWVCRRPCRRNLQLAAEIVDGDFLKVQQVNSASY